MNRVRPVVTSLAITLLVNLALVVSAAAQQPTRMLRPPPTEGIPVIPYMEGWFDNGDGTITVSFGYHNRNVDIVTVPMGENNYIEPARLDGMQPETYFTGRHAGVFAITIPDSDTVWWHIKSGENEALKVPGDKSTNAYELDRNPRPQGSVQPLIWFDGENKGSGPEGVIAADTKTVAVGQPLTLEVGTEDPSVRDSSNPLFAKPLDSRVSWYKHQGPGEVTFTEHPSMPLTDTSRLPSRGLSPFAATAVTVPEGKGPARAIASFSEPGEYMIRIRLDNWKSSDSDGLDQCCWSNAYQRVRVTP